MNIRSIKNKFAEFRDLLIEEAFDILAISETWLQPELDSSYYKTTGYDIHRVDRVDGRGGGVMMYTKSELKCKTQTHVSNSIDGMEQLWIKFINKQTSYAVGVIYRPYRHVTLNTLDDTLNTLSLECDNILFMGDLNENLLDKNRFTDDILFMLNTYDMKQLITCATRITATTETLLDIICINNNWSYNESGTLDTSNLSDHDAVYAVVDLATEVPNKTRYYRNFKNIDMDRFAEDAQKMNWSRIYFLDDINEKVEYFNSCITALLDFYAPKIPMNIRKQKAPWMTYNIKNMLKIRNKAYKKYIRTRSEVDRRYYCDLRNYINRAVKREKKNYYVFSTQENIKDSRSFWSKMHQWGFINKKNGNGANTDEFDPNEVNTFFINCADELNSDDALTDYFYDNLLENNEMNTFTSVEPYKIQKILSEIKSNATSLDGISAQMIKICYPFCKNEFCHIINTSLYTGIVPLSWKSSKVIPLKKKDDTIQLKDLRPISILPPGSKVLEKIVHAQITDHLETNKILSEVQSGFRKAYSTTTALTKINDEIIRATDKGQLSVAVLIDMSKAFDSINTELVLAKLFSYGCRGYVWEWFRNYLSERRQRVEINSGLDVRLSDEDKIKKGVPQGTILGPVLFNLFMIDLVNVIKHCDIQLYADDVQIMLNYKPEDAPIAFQKVNEDLDNIHCWTSKNGLKINSNKTHAIIFGKKIMRENAVVDDLYIDNVPIAFSEVVCNLGLRMDNNLNYAAHISSLSRAAFLKLKSMYHLKDYLSKDAKIKICDSLVLSRLNYCDEVYGPCLRMEDANRLQKVQNSCIRYSCQVARREHISPYLRQIGWLNMKERRLHHLCCLIHKVVINKKPSYLYAKIEKRSEAHNVELRQSELRLSVPMHHTEFFKKSFSYQAAKIYNQVPNDIKKLSLSGFKERVYHLISAGYLSS